MAADHVPPADPPGRPPAEAPRHIAYVLTKFPKLSETFVLDEIIELERRGWTVDVYTLILESEVVSQLEAAAYRRRAHWYPRFSAATGGALWFWLRRSPARLVATLGAAISGTLRSPPMLLRTIALIPPALAMARAVDQSSVTQLHAHFAVHGTTAAWIISRLTRRPYSFTCHAYDIYVDRAFLARKVHDAAAVVTISDDGGDVVRAVAAPDDRHKVRTIRLGVRPDRFPIRDRQPDTRPAIVLEVGRLDPIKGMADLVRAMRLVADHRDDIVVEIVGEGPQRGELEALIAELRLDHRVTLLGAVPRGEVTARLEAAAVFAFPARRDRRNTSDGIPVALMEAMAIGVPVISTDVAGIPELVHHGDAHEEDTGLRIASNDPPSLAAAIERLVDDPGLRDRLAAAGRRIIEREYDLDVNVVKLIEILESVGGGATGSAGISARPARSRRR